MDTITHIALGACIGEIALGKKIGKRAMLFGALAQSIPDIDFLAAFWLPPANNLLAHRGLTHSFLFMIIVSPLLGLALKRTHRNWNISLSASILFFVVQLSVHDFLDAFNAYGTGWFEPFWHKRIAFNVLFVADPFFSIWPGIAFFAMIFLKRRTGLLIKWARAGMMMVVLYLCYAILNKWMIERSTRKELTRQRIHFVDYFTTPTPFNNWLWYVIVRQDNGFYISYRSVFEVNRPMQFTYFPRQDSLLMPVRARREVSLLKQFSQGYYTVEQWKDTLVFNDLRFGQMIGWNNPQAKFAFHYYLDPPLDNTLVVQRGRVAKWDSAAVHSLINRILVRQ